jgi:serine/threonine protein kinase
MSTHIGEHFGNYRLTRLLGKGGFAETYLGEHTYLQTFAAVKILQAPLTPFDQDAFFTEARTIARLKHPNIIRVLDFGVEHDMPYLVMDYAPGGTLRQRHPRGEPLPLPIVVPYVKQVAAALQYAHGQKIIHRDVKPENMLLGEVDEVLLGDFGVATIVLTTLMPQAHNVAGTIAYMAPEQIQGQPQPASDQYALGVVVYEWLTGITPFRGTYSEVAMQHERKPPPPLRDLGAAIPLETEQVVLTALAKEPYQRFGSVQAFANALEQSSYSSASTQPMPPTFSSSPLPSIANDPQVYLSTATAAHLATPQQSLTPRREPTASGQPQRAGFTPAPASRTSFSGAPSGAMPKLTPPLVPLVPTQSSSSTGDLPATPTPSRWTSIALPWKILLSIVALLLVVSIGLTYYTAVYRPNQLHAGSAASAGQASPQMLYKQITSRPPAWMDPLTKADNYGWWDTPALDKNGNIEYGCRFIGGIYYGFAKDGQFAGCTALGTNFSDFLYQVQLTVISGHTAGVEFRANPVNGDCYYFRISTDGTYIFAKDILANGGGYNRVTIISGKTTAIKQGLNQPNTVAVLARGSTFYLYINGQYIIGKSDTTYQSGEIGVYAESDASPVEDSFHNVQVWTL